MKAMNGLIMMGLLGCGTKDAEPASTDSGSDDTAASTADTPDADDAGPATREDMPENPAPFTLTLSDGRSLTFDQPSCQHFRGSTNFRAFWRDGARAHNYVLTMQVMQSFDGVGTYESTTGRVDVKLQEEAPQTGAPTYWTDGELGDTASLTVAYIDEDVAWGEASVSGLHDPAGGTAVSVSPSALPVWCPDLEI